MEGCNVGEERRETGQWRQSGPLVCQPSVSSDWQALFIQAEIKLQLKEERPELCAVITASHKEHNKTHTYTHTHRKTIII